MAGTVDYVHSWNQKQLITYNLNPGTRVNTSRTGAITYTDLEGIAPALGISPFGNAVYERVNDGSSQFDGVNFSLEKRLSAGWAARVSYAIGYARGNAEANQTYINQLQVGADPKLDLNFGPLDNDRKQNLAISGRYEIPHTGGLNVSGVYRWMSGIPITIQDTNFDPDRNGILFDPVARFVLRHRGQLDLRREQGRAQWRARSQVPPGRHALRLSLPQGREPDVRHELRVLQPREHGELR